MAFEPGARLGPYEIVSAVGAGGMGEVYRATDTRLDRLVAIKVLNASLGADPQFRERFGREARAISQLTHPNICTLYDLGEHDGTSYLVLEYLEGKTLADRLGRSQDRPLPLNEALTIGTQIADALAAAHRAGIVHRDLKPGNVMLTRSGAGSTSSPQAKLLDFGLAKTGTGVASSGPATPVHMSQLSAAPTLTSPLTLAGSIVGTLMYMSPEQLQGTEADTRSDIFAFGAMLYEMVTGRKAFGGKSQVSVMAAILDQDPPSLASVQPALPPALDRVVRKCLEKDPEARWQSARDLQSELEWIAESGSQPAPPGAAAGSAGAAPAGTSGRWPWTWIAAAVVLPIVAAAATWAAMHFAPAPKLQPMRFAIVPPAAQPVASTNADRQVVVSADGRNVVYVSSAVAGSGSGGGQLMVRSIDRLEVEPIRGITGARSPFLSPDGKWIGFFQGNELRKVSITGGPPLTLCRFDGTARGASWGLDDTVVFATSDPTTGLVAVAGGGGEPKVLTKPNTARGEQDHLFPSVLPDGRAVLFTITAAGPIENAQIAALDLKTGQQKILVRGGSQAEYVESGHLVYGVAGTLRAVRFDPAKLAVIGDPVPVVEQVGMVNTGAAEFGVSRTGALVFFPGSFANVAGAGAARSLVWVNRQGREDPVKAPPRAYFALRLSPDDTRIALDVRDQENDIWVWDLMRQTLTRLTFDPGNDVFPVWTPDGRRIAFSTSRGSASQNLFWQPADGTGMAERLTTSPIAQFANSFSPDGKQLVLQDGGTGAIAGDSTTSDISVVSVTTETKARPLIQSKFTKRNADISPDGQWIAYESNDSGQFEVYVRPFPNVNGGRWQISTGGGSKPIWGRNGRELFYVDGHNFLMTVPVQSGSRFSAGNPTKLLEAKYFFGVQQSRSYDVSRDGQRFLMLKEAAVDPQKTAETPASMVVVLNWVEELKQRLPRN